MAEFDKTSIDKTSSWFKNVAKSLGYAGYATVKEQMPFVVSTFEDNKELVVDAKRLLRMKGSSVRLSNIIGETAAKNIDSLKVGGKNALSDLKSGKLYNKERKDQAVRDSSGFGDDEIDWDIPDNEDSIDVEITEEYDEDTDTNRPHITINSNITEDNPMVTAIHGQSNLIVETSKINAKQNAIIADLQFKSMNSFMSQLHGAIDTVNSNVSQIVEFNSNKMDSYVGASLNFYENQIKLMGESLVELKKISTPAERTVKKYENPYDDLSGMQGGFSFRNYSKLIKKQLGEALDNNMFTSQFKVMLGTEDAFLETIANPLGWIPQTVIKSMIPKATQTIMDSFNSSFENFLPLLFNKVYEWGEKTNDPFGIAKLIGQTFGIKTYASTTIDPSKYEKGSVPFDGVTKKAITSVIPTYLRKILAHLTKTSEIVFDSEKGKWTTIDEIKKDYNASLKRVATSPYSDIWDIKEEVEKLNLNQDQARRFNESIDNFFANLSKSNKRFNPNETDRSYDLIKTLFKDDNGIVDDNMSEIFRKIIKHLPRSTQMRIAREQLEGRVNVTNWVREHEMNPDTMTEVVTSGILNKNLYKTQDEINAENQQRRERERNRRNSDRRNYTDISTYLGYTQDQLDEFLNSRNESNSSDTIDPTVDRNSHRTIKEYLGDKLSGITKSINKILTAGDKTLYRIIFGKYDENNTHENNLPLFDRITNKIIDSFEWFRKGFDKITDKLIGDNGIITKLEQSEFMKKVKSGYNKAKGYLFGKQNDDGTYSDGLLSDVGNELVKMKNNVKNYIMGPDNENSVLNNIKGMFGSLKTSVKEYLFGDGINEGAKDKAKGVLIDFGGALKEGFQSFANVFFGTKDTLKDGKLQNRINVDELTNKLKENAPKDIAAGIVGGGLGLIAGMGGFGLLGSLFLGPMSGVVLGIGTSMLSRSEKFKNMLFGEHDENGERTGGFISKSVQTFFKDNKNFLIGGATLGTISGLMGNLGVLPSLVAGGPITGALIGLGAGILKKSETFQSFMFGDLDDDGKRRGGLITKITNTVNSDQAMRKLGHAGAGAIIGGIGGATLSSFGLLGSLSLGPLGGAIVGAGAGIALAADKWKEAIFGKFDENGNKTEAGLLSKLAVATSVNVLQPLKYKALEWRFGVESWFEQKIALPIMESIEPIKEEFRRVGNKIINVFEDIVEKFHIPDIVGGIKEHVFKPVVDSVKKVSNYAINGITKATGWILQKPVQLISMVVDRLIVPKHMRDGLRDARKMILKNIVDSKPGQVITKTVHNIGDFTKGMISGVGDFAKTVIKGTFRFLGRGLLAVVKAPFKAIAAPVKAVGKLSNFNKYRNKNYGSQETLHDIRSGNRGFAQSIGDLLQTFNPFSDIRASAKYQGIDMDALRKRVIKEKFTDKDGNVIPHTEKELKKEVNRLARKYPGGAHYQEERIGKSNKYKEKIKDRAKNRQEILKKYKEAVEGHQEYALQFGYSLLNKEDRDKVSFKDLNKIEDSIYNRIYGKEYKGKSKFEQDNFKNQRAAQNATVNMSNDVKAIRTLLTDGIKVNSDVKNDFNTTGMTDEHRDAIDRLNGRSESEIKNKETDTIGTTIAEQKEDIKSNNPITSPLSSTSDEMINFATSGMTGAHKDAMERLNRRSELAIYNKEFNTLGDTWAEQKQEREANEKEEQRQSMLQKILGAVNEGNETRKKSAFDWGKIFSKTGLITAGILAALPFIIKFFKDPAGALSSLGGVIGSAIREFLGLDDKNEDRTDSSGNTQVNSDAVEASVRGGGQVISTVARKSSKGINAIVRGAQKVTNFTSDLYNKVTNTKVHKTASNIGKNTADNAANQSLKLVTNTADDSIKNKAIREFMQKLKKVPSQFGDYIRNKFAKKGSDNVINKIINMVDNVAAKITVKTLQGNYSRLARALSYVVPGLNIVAGALDIGFVTYGIISGGTKSETANLFHVNQKDVTIGMRTVSAGLKGLQNYSWAFVLTILFDLVYEMFNYDILHEIALLIYNHLLPNTDDDKLKNNIDAFKKDYDKYTLTEQIRKGNVMYDESGNIKYNEDGSLMLKEGAKVESFDSFNDRTNKSLWQRLKEKITGKDKNKLSDEEKKKQIASVEEAYKNGAIDERTYRQLMYDIDDRPIWEKLNTGGSNLLTSAKDGAKNLGTLIFGKKEDSEGIKEREDKIVKLNEKFKNGEIDSITYNEELDKLKDEIDTLTGKDGIFNKIGTFVSGINTAGSKWLNAPLLDENGEPVIDPYTKQPVPKNMIRRLIQNTFDGNLGKRTADFLKQINDAGSKWWNDPLLDENGEPVIDPYTDQPVYNNSIHRLLTNTFDGNLGKRAGEFFKQINDAGSKWWNDPLLDENGEPVIDPYNNQPVYKNSIHRLLTNTFDGNLGKRAGEFFKQINDAGSKWWNAPLLDENGNPVLDKNGKEVKKNLLSRFIDNSLNGNLSNLVGDFFKSINDTGAKWFDTELNLVDPVTKKKVKVREIGTYIINSLLSIPNKIGEFFKNFFDNDDNSTKSRSFWDNGTTSYSKSGWNDYWMNQSIGAGIGGEIEQTDVGRTNLSDAQSKNINKTDNGTSYKQKLEELIGLYRQSSAYGWRTIGGEKKFHYGVDLVRPNNNDPVPSFTSGTVEKVVSGYAPNSGYYGNSDGGYFGNHVKVTDDKGNTNIYAHLNGVNVKPGDKVSVGSQIGIQGHTGSSTGSHLHYEVRKGVGTSQKTSAIDPLNYLRTGYTSSNFYDGSYSSSGSSTTSSGTDYLGLGTMTSSLTEALSSPYAPFIELINAMNAKLGNATNTSTSSDGSGQSTTGIDSSISGVSTTTSLDGNGNAEKIWNYLKGKGLSDAATAGILGVWKNESGLQPNNVENQFEKYYGNDTQYTQKVNSTGKWPETGSNHKVGYGLAQWTYFKDYGENQRKNQLLNYAKKSGKSIDDLGMQLDFSWQELNSSTYNNGSSSKVKETVFNAPSPEEAALGMLIDYEMPGWNRNKGLSYAYWPRRRDDARAFYNQFAGKTGTEKGKNTNIGGQPVDIPDQFETSDGKFERVLSKDVVIDGGGDNKSIVEYKLDSGFKNVFNKISGLKEKLENNPQYSIDNNFKTMTYTPPITNIDRNHVGGDVDGVTLPDKMYEILNNMVTYLSSIASNTAETSTNIKNIKTTKIESKTSTVNNTSTDTTSGNRMIDIANKQKNARSSDAYKNARLIASGAH